ncbi:hypothetical protein [Yersinia sp. Marseille-Q3913]|uniref:hypothetical protein n=1 Tax=Yersinia sp. Marseille-Q3913 TaxID=2830769 RepID=UPI001BAF25A9|nr:hypothetical protein [Yersinia sp. Marseille-Q3913]MBS0056245.1 hypothetical protein [Yersinia sp. Marseille-Q3913]
MINKKKNDDGLLRRFVATDHSGRVAISQGRAGHGMPNGHKNKYIVYQLVRYLFAGD